MPSGGRWPRRSAIIIPPVHIQDNMQLKPGEYSILLKGNEIARAELMPGYFLAMNPGSGRGQAGRRRHPGADLRTSGGLDHRKAPRKAP